MPLPSERDWVARIRAGDHVAFERLFRCYYPGLCSFAARAVGDDVVAEDLVQDVFRRLWERHATWTVATSVEAYLYRATRNRVFDYFDHRRVETRWQDRVMQGGADDADVPLAAGPDTVLHATELADAIERAAQALPERCRQVFFLKWTQGLTYAQISEAMDISVKTVETQMTRAYRALRERLGRFVE